MKIILDITVDVKKYEFKNRLNLMLLHDHRHLHQGTKLCELYIFKLLNNFAVPWFISLSKPLQNASPKCLW